MTKEALIIVDAWQNLFPEDTKSYPELPEYVQTFCAFLNSVAERELDRGTHVFHASSNLPVSKEFDLTRQHVIYDNGRTGEMILDLSYDRYYFCGFHYGRCIRNKINILIKSVEPERVGIVLNLCMAYPADRWSKKYDNDIEHYLWNHDGFEPLKNMVRKNE